MAHPPQDAEVRRAIAPVICYDINDLPVPDIALYATALASAQPVESVTVPPRDAQLIHVPAGSFLRISCPDGPQVGDLNLFNAHDLSEHFFAGKTRAIHGTHVSVGDRLWSSLPTMRPLATIVEDTLDWYGLDDFGGGVHDVIGTRCDPYTNMTLKGAAYHNCCHSNLTRALMDGLQMDRDTAERHVHDVLNVFMCTGFTRDTGQYFMKASPARAGDSLTLFAEIDLLAAMSACPGGDCGAVHSSDVPQCFAMSMDVLTPSDGSLKGWLPPEVNRYDRSHGR